MEKETLKKSIRTRKTTKSTLIDLSKTVSPLFKTIIDPVEDGDASLQGDSNSSLKTPGIYGKHKRAFSDVTALKSQEFYSLTSHHSFELSESKEILESDYIIDVDVNLTITIASGSLYLSSAPTRDHR